MFAGAQLLPLRMGERLLRRLPISALQLWRGASTDLGHSMHTSVIPWETSDPAHEPVDLDKYIWAHSERTCSNRVAEMRQLLKTRSYADCLESAKCALPE